MAFCSQCGSQLPEGARFCPKCGTDAAADAAPAQTALRTDDPKAPSQPYNVTPPVSSGGSGAAMILPIVVVIAVLVIGLVWWTQRDGARPIAGTAKQEAAVTGITEREATSDDARAVDRASDAADIAQANTVDTATATSAAALDSAFFRDPQGAAERYAGPIRISGVIATMVTPGRTPALSLEGRSRFNYMIVNFPVGYRERLAPLSKGMMITVDCGSAQSLGGTTILSGCALD